LVAWTTVFLALVLAPVLSASQQVSIIDLGVPPHAVGNFPFPIPIKVNSRGQILGYYSDNSSGYFVQRPWLWQDGAMSDLGTSVEADGYLGSLDINVKGQIVGTDGTRVDQHAFLWQDGAITDLETLPGAARSYARAINDHGQVVGVVSGDHFAGPFLWQDGVMTLLEMATPAYSPGDAVAINNRGQVVGYNGDRFVLWEKGVMIDLGGLSPVAINDQGQVVGYCVGHLDEACLWERGTITHLATLPYPPGGGYTFISGINEHGQVAGVQDTVAGRHPVIWERDTITDLTPGGPSGAAYSINDHGQVVGQSGGRACLWQHGSMTDLGTLSGDIASEAYSINDRGQVVGVSGTQDTFVIHAVLWEVRGDGPGGD
jgi:probable HAF family extracellular repeat protein